MKEQTMAIYVLQVGEYEDVEILGIYGDRELANTEWIRALEANYIKPTLISYVLDETFPQPPVRDYNL
jgi:hypothetical protein